MTAAMQEHRRLVRCEAGRTTEVEALVVDYATLRAYAWGESVWKQHLKEVTQTTTARAGKRWENENAT